MVKFKVSDSPRNSVDVMGRHFSGGTIYDTEIEGIPEDYVRECNFQIIGESKKQPIVPKKPKTSTKHKK